MGEMTHPFPLRTMMNISGSDGEKGERDRRPGGSIFDFSSPGNIEFLQRKEKGKLAKKTHDSSPPERSPISLWRVRRPLPWPVHVPQRADRDQDGRLRAPKENLKKWLPINLEFLYYL